MYSLYGIHYKPMQHIARVYTIQTVSSFVQACYWLELYMEICGVLAPEAGVLSIPEWVSSTWKLVLRFQSVYRVAEGSSKAQRWRLDVSLVARKGSQNGSLM